MGDQKQECATTYKTKTTYEKKQECHYVKVPKQVPEEKCHYVKVPKKVPEQKCHYINVPKCHNVPEEKCSEYTVPHCKKIPHEVCKKVPKEQCHYIHFYAPGKEKHRECQKEVKSYKQEYKTEHDKVCKQIEVPKCVTKYTEACTYEEKQHCETTY